MIFIETIWISCSVLNLCKWHTRATHQQITEWTIFLDSVRLPNAQRSLGLDSMCSMRIRMAKLSTDDVVHRLYHSQLLFRLNWLLQIVHVDHLQALSHKTIVYSSLFSVFSDAIIINVHLNLGHLSFRTITQRWVHSIQNFYPRAGHENRFSQQWKYFSPNNVQLIEILTRESD